MASATRNTMAITRVAFIDFTSPSPGRSSDPRFSVSPATRVSAVELVLISARLCILTEGV